MKKRSIENMNGAVSGSAVVEIRRKWEDLDSDCLANVFSRVGMESLVLDVPFVCKSWSSTSLNSPICWQVLSFPDFEPSPLFIDSDNNADDSDTFETFGPFYDKFVEVYGIDRSRFSITGFIKLIVNRSKGMAIRLDLPDFCTEEAYRYVADACPRVEVLSFSDDLLLFPHSRVISQVIGKWKLLVHLQLGGNMNRIARHQCSRGRSNISKHFMAVLEGANPETLRQKRLYEILVELCINCKYIRSLSFYDVEVGKDEALAIVTLLPNLEILQLIDCSVPRDRLVALLQGCKKLSFISVILCKGVGKDDEELRKLVKHIGKVHICTGEKFYDVMDMCRKFILLEVSLAELQSRSNLVQLP